MSTDMSTEYRPILGRHVGRLSVDVSVGMSVGTSVGMSVGTRTTSRPICCDWLSVVYRSTVGGIGVLFRFLFLHRHATVSLETNSFILPFPFKCYFSVWCLWTSLIAGVLPITFYRVWRVQFIPPLPYATSHQQSGPYLSYSPELKQKKMKGIFS